MNRILIGIAALAVALVVLVRAPVFPGARYALADAAIGAGVYSVALLLMAPLADANDPRALNNIGAMLVNSPGPPEDVDRARALFERASALGSKRARLNLGMVKHGGCGLHIRGAAMTAAELASLDDGDPVTGKLIQDCLYFDATGDVLRNRPQRMIAADKRLDPEDAAALLRSGWTLLNVARTTRRVDEADDDAVARYDAEVTPVVRQAMETLLAAYDGGATGAYEPLRILGMQFDRQIGEGPLARRVRSLHGWEWVSDAARRGDWEAGCNDADERMLTMMNRGTYTRAEFDAVVADARACIDRRPTQNRPTWHDGPEWLAYIPSYTPETPSLVIGPTAARLRSLLFLDADRGFRKGSAGEQTK